MVLGGGNGIGDGAMDGGGEFGGEGGVAEAVGAIGDLASAVEDDDSGKGIDAKEDVEAVSKDVGGAGFYFFEVGAD